MAAAKRIFFKIKLIEAFVWFCSGCSRIVQVLVADKNIDVNAVNDQGDSPLRNARQWGRLEILGMLKAHPDIDTNV